MVLRRFLDCLFIYKINDERNIEMLKTNSRRHLHFVLGMLLIMSMIMSTSFITMPQVQAAERTFTVGFDAEFPPYGYKDANGEYVGFDLDLAQEVCTRNGWTLKKQPIDWDFKDKELNSGSIDCIWNGFTIDGRENEYTWSVPYVDNSQVVVVKSGSDIKTLADLKDKVVVVQADSSALAAFTGDDASDENKALAKSFKELQQVGDYNSAFLNLESEMVDAVCLDIGVANYQIASRGNKFTMLDEKVSSEKYGIGFKKGNTELKAKVEQTLFAMVGDGKFTEIAKKWGLESSVCLTASDTSKTERTTLTVGFDAEFPPYAYKDENGEYVGFDLELAEEVCKRNGWTLIKQPIDWNNKEESLNSNAVDCIWNGFTINGRENDYTWSVPYIDNSQVIVVKADSKIKTLSDLKGKTVAVQTDSSALDAFTGETASEKNKSLARSLKELKQVDDYTAAFAELENGTADAVCLDMSVAEFMVVAKANKFAILDEQIANEQYGIGFKKGNTELKDTVQNTLFKMKREGVFEEIAGKWGLERFICLNESDAHPEAYSSKEKMSFGQIALQLLDGVWATLIIFFLTLLFSMPLGLLLTFIRMSKLKVIQLVARIYISIMRGTPLMLQLIVVFYAPYYLFGISLGQDYRFYAVIIGFSLNYAAYFAEIFRAGIQSVPNGQREAAAVLGYSKSQTFGKIIFPQMVKHILPPVTNEIITLVKDTSLAFVLTYIEMFTIAKQIAAAQTSIVPLFAAGLFYYVFNMLVAFLMGKLEKRLNYYR